MRTLRRRPPAPALLALAAALLLAACGGKSDDPVVNLRQERDQGVRRATLRKLAEAEGAARAGHWAGFLRESDPEIPRLAASALRGAADLPGFREPPRALLDALLEAAERKEPEVRSEVLLALGRLYAEDPRVPPKVLAFLADPDTRVRRSALEAFQSFGPAAGGIDLSPLRALLRDPALSFEAALTLSTCGDAAPGAADRLADAVENRADPARAQQAAAGLARLGARASSAAPRLARALPGAPPGVARDLCDALGFSAS
ncbi:MAG: HEAT repeat domain-containing protein, partial [Planctomycetes bacterium]|nr:HEAT repeat domain-containing protein [Planctomycetota bacterium]